MANKDNDKVEKFLGDGAAGDVAHPEAGRPAAIEIVEQDLAPVTETQTHRKHKEDEDK